LRVYGGEKKMMVNYNTKEIQIKIVYYGCALSGKTTSLKNLFSGFGKIDQLTSIETTTGRTLFFDFGTLQLKGGEWAIKIKLLTVTGQDFYASTRPATLTGADGIIFMIDSQRQFLNDNIQSWKELNYYYSDNIYDIPIIFCLNKQDLSDIIEINEIKGAFSTELYEKIKFIKTIAINGKGVLESFKIMLNFVFPSIKIR
jgi:mutual gliding-motility protein MglA